MPVCGYLNRTLRRKTLEELVLILVMDPIFSFHFFSFNPSIYVTNTQHYIARKFPLGVPKYTVQTIDRFAFDERAHNHLYDHKN